jgi:hypothetical protein
MLFPLSRLALSRISLEWETGNFRVGKGESASINFPSLGRSTFNTPAKEKKHQNVKRKLFDSCATIFFKFSNKKKYNNEFWAGKVK